MAEYECEKRLGEWVAARCRKRAEECRISMPPEVQAWFRAGGGGFLAGKDSSPPPVVLVWLLKTIDNPDWPRP